MRLFILAKPRQLAKQRLSTVLDEGQRAALATAMLHDLLVQALAARSIDRVSLLTSDPVLADQARRCGVEPIFEGVPAGLNAAARRALSQARSDRDDGLVILPADLPLATAADLDSLVQAWRPQSVVAVPACDGGTNALVLDPAARWSFAFGADSFASHLSIALSLGLGFTSIGAERLAFDVDWPGDLVELICTGQPLGRSTAAFIEDLARPEGSRRWA